MPDVLIICPTIHRHAISHHIHSDLSLALHVELQSYDETQESSTGTCTLLRHFSNRIPCDFILLPCDFLPPPSLPLTTLLHKFRTDTVVDGSIVTTCWFPKPQFEKGSFPDDWGSSSTLPVVWDDATSTLLHLDTLDDQDQTPEDLELKLSLVTRCVPVYHCVHPHLTQGVRYPNSRISQSLVDSHVYVCKRSVLDLLHKKDQYDSFREEFLPWLCKIQHSQAKRERYSPSTVSLTCPSSNIHSSDTSPIPRKHSISRCCLGAFNLSPSKLYISPLCEHRHGAASH